MSTQSRISGALLTVLGVALIICGITAQIAWLAFCFGTVIIGVLLLFFAPTILFIPYTLATTIGGGMVVAGCTKLSGR